MSDRLSKLQEFHNEDPNDPFTIYALALEYIAIDKGQARGYFERLLNDHEDYESTYYHAAQLYIEMELYDKAKEVFEKGMVISERQKNHHALKELKSAYQNFLFENM